MNALADGRREIILGADQEVLEGVKKFFAQKGQKAVIVYEDDCFRSPCDVIIYSIDWEKPSVYISPFKADGYCPNIMIALNCLSSEQIVEQICKLLEAINF